MPRIILPMFLVVSGIDQKLVLLPAGRASSLAAILTISLPLRLGYDCRGSARLNLMYRLLHNLGSLRACSDLTGC